MAPKTVLITGCSAGGIGGAIALALAKLGHYVFATARDTNKIGPELLELPNVSALTLDVSKTASVQAAASATAERGVDVIINNAGSGYTMPMLDVDIDAAQKLYDTNVWGPVRMVQAFSEQLIASRGRIVNINSSAANLNTPYLGSYLSSKAALKTISDTLRLELAPFGITVVTVMAGVVNTLYGEPHFALPATSHYSVNEELISDWATGKTKPPGSSPEEFAELIMDDIVGDIKDVVVWKGYYADQMRELSRAPDLEIDSFMGRDRGLENVGKTPQQGA
ncbi:hypothetical protein F5Y10DRAFT_252440 [Nemania abortiva]|nr:hypothetical protein F5Y10DRAFT_252440 [Nemania abortiva]